MIYELRRYQLTSPPVAKHFNDHMGVMADIFPQYDMSLVGAWDAAIAPSMPFHTYMLRWRDLEHREQSWSAFYADERFEAGRQRMNERAGGLVVASHDVSILRPAPYSPEGG